MNKLKGQKIVSCRICKGDHWTTRCPYKDTLGPMQKELAEQLGLSTGEKEKLPGGTRAWGCGWLDVGLGVGRLCAFLESPGLSPAVNGLSLLWLSSHITMSALQGCGHILCVCV